MTDRQREPNTRLAAVMGEAGFSRKGLARRIVDATAGWDEPLRADHNDVRKWLEGMMPRDPKPRIIAEILSRKLGRRITFDDIGFTRAEGPDEEALVADGLTYPTEPNRAVDLLHNLTDADLNDRRVVVEATLETSIAPQIITGYMFSGPIVDTVEAVLWSGASVADRIRRTTAHLMDMDFQFGGGHTRRMLIEFFRNQVVPLLRVHHPDKLRREIFSAAAETAQLLGWSAYDAGRHGVAMRYFTQGLRLAHEAEDHMLGARMLASLSHQANYLGHFQDALQFARAAQSATLGRATKNVATMFVAMEARALASLGDQLGVAHALNRADKLFAARNSAKEPEPEWIHYFDELELAGEKSHCFRDLGDSRQTKLLVTQAIDPVLTPPRTRAFIQMVSAAGSVSANEPEEALALARDALRLADGLQSARFLRYLSDFRQSLNAVRDDGHYRADFDNMLGEHGLMLPANR